MQQKTEVGQAVSEVLDVLASKLGASVEQLWMILVKQQTVEAFSDFFYAGFMVLLAVIMSGAVWYFTRENAKSEREYLRNDAIICRSIIGVVGIVLVLFSSSFVFSGAKRTINPEYYALQEIRSLVK